MTQVMDSQLATMRGELVGFAYRMLGSPFEAEDAAQETMLRAWRHGADFDPDRGSLRTWVYRIATNVCLDMLRSARRRGLDLADRPGGDLGEPLPPTAWVLPMRDDPALIAEQRDTVRLAFVAALQHLPPRQRAVLILRDVLGFSGAEVAAALRTTPASVYSALQRAHETVDHRLPELSQQATLSSLGNARLREIVDRYVQAWERHDVDAIVAMLTESVTIAMPPTATWYRGRAAVEAFLGARPLDGSRRWWLTPSRANGQLAARAHLWDPAAGGFRLHHTAVLTLGGGLVDEINTFLGPWALTLQGPEGDGCRVGGHGDHAADHSWPPLPPKG
jgi:RNA polymerase sigma-70 factor (ECF subfamily)